MRRSLIIIIMVWCGCLLSAGMQAHARDIRNPSGLPVPRFVSLKSGEVNVRTGPGTRYPIQWVYRREGWPVEIVEEFDQWRKIRDIEGSAGWVHKTMLDGRRNALIRGKEERILRSEPEESSRPVLKAKPMVLVRVVECGAQWCRVQAQSRKAWLRKTYLWGIYPQEILE